MKRFCEPQPIRFRAGTRRRLDKIARAHRLKISDLIRRAVDHQLSEWERSGVISFAKSDQ